MDIYVISLAANQHSGKICQKKKKIVRTVCLKNRNKVLNRVDYITFMNSFVCALYKFDDMLINQVLLCL